MRFFWCGVLSFLSAFSLHADEAVRLAWTGKFERNLSAYNLFADAELQRPNAGLIAYDIITPLFSDYAEKHRFVYLPSGTAAAFEAYDAFDFPVGAVLVKTFSYPHDFREPSLGRRLIETRLLFHTQDEWTGAAYLWNDEQTDAVLKVAGKQLPVEWIDVAGVPRSTDYIVPNMNHCKACHRGYGTTAPLGPTARQLNRDVVVEGETLNQLVYWARLGILQGEPQPEEAMQLAAWDDPNSGPLGERVLGYFDVNCAHCHNPAGLASGTRLDLRHTQDDLLRRGVMHRPTAAGNAARGRYFAIVPGNPEASFLLYRLKATAPDVRMPEVGRTIPHDEGVALIAEWIASLKTTD